MIARNASERDEWLEARVGELADYALSLRCHTGCERLGLLPLSTIAQRYGHLQLRAARAQLKCVGCKRPPAQITLLDHVFDGQLPSFRVQLLP